MFKQRVTDITYTSFIDYTLTHQNVQTKHTATQHKGRLGRYDSKREHPDPILLAID